MSAQLAVLDRKLSVPADPGSFSDAELMGCDEPVRRYFRAAIADGTPLARAATLRMRGSIKFGNWWVPFRADELLAPLQGYLWPASVAGGLLRGSDHYGDTGGAMSWKLLGLVPVIRASGPDVARSAMGRAAAEAVWLPTALLPRYGVHWHAEDDEHLLVDLPIGGHHVAVRIAIDSAGLVRSVHLDRWYGEGKGAFEWCPFGIDVTATRTYPCGITMPAEGTGGWFHSSRRWAEGQFLRYRISELTLI